jgi:DNA adenine methylase
MPTVPSEIVEVGFKQLALNRISFSGLGTMSGGPLGGREQKSKSTIGSRWNPERLCGDLASIQARWTGEYLPLQIHASCCTNFDFAELIKDETCPALLYLDPPYFIEGNKLYQCGFSRDDHERLASLLRETPYAWVLSYDDCSEIRELYRWAGIERIDDVQYSITGSRKKSELLIHPATRKASFSRPEDDRPQERNRLSALPSTWPEFSEWSNSNTQHQLHSLTDLSSNRHD